MSRASSWQIYLRQISTMNSLTYIFHTCHSCVCMHIYVNRCQEQVRDKYLRDNNTCQDQVRDHLSVSVTIIDVKIKFVTNISVTIIDVTSKFVTNISVTIKDVTIKFVTSSWQITSWQIYRDSVEEVPDIGERNKEYIYTLDFLKMAEWPFLYLRYLSRTWRRYLSRTWNKEYIYTLDFLKMAEWNHVYHKVIDSWYQ